MAGSAALAWPLHFLSVVVGLKRPRRSAEGSIAERDCRISRRIAMVYPQASVWFHPGRADDRRRDHRHPGRRRHPGLLEVRQAVAHRRGGRPPEQDVGRLGDLLRDRPHRTRAGTPSPSSSRPTPPTSCRRSAAARPPASARAARSSGRTRVWIGLQFSIPDPHLYMPHYTSAGTASAATFVASATGDLDCNKEVATFVRNGSDRRQRRHDRQPRPRSSPTSSSSRSDPRGARETPEGHPPAGVFAAFASRAPTTFPCRAPEDPIGYAAHSRE